MYKAYLSLTNRLNLNRDKFVQESAESLPEGSLILDVGAGPTKYRQLFSHCKYQAQDFAQHTGSTEGPLAEYDSWKYGQLDYVCDAIAIPVKDQFFDAILCTEVIEHVKYPDLVLKEIARITKSGGKLFLTAPLASGLHQEPDHYYGGFTPYYYKDRLSELGYKNINVIPNGGFYSFHSQETQRFIAWIAPWRLPVMQAILFFPLWLLFFPWAKFIYPFLAPILDQSLDKHKGFTVGYHVIAQKK